MAARPAKCVPCLCFLVLLPLMLTALPAAGQVFVPVNVPGATFTTVNGMDRNNAQALVGNYVDTGGVEHGYLFTGGSFLTLDDPSGILTIPEDVNNVGQVVGLYNDANKVSHGFVWSNGTFATVDFPGSLSTFVAAINNAGSMVGGYQDSSNVGHGFILSDGTFTTFDVPGATYYTELDGINNEAHLAGTFVDALGTHAFLLTDSGQTTINAPNSSDTFAQDLNNADEVVGGYYQTDQENIQAFTYSAGTFTIVVFPGAIETDLTSLSDSGVLTGFYSTEEASGGFIRTNGPFAYAPVRSANSVAVFDVATTLPVATVQVGSGPVGIGFGPNGNVAYVANYQANSVSVVNATNNTVVATIPVGTSPLGVAVTPDGLFAYVANNFSNNVSVISTVSNTVVATVPVGTIPSFIAITPDGNFAYVTNQTSNNVSVISTASNAVVATVTVESGPVGLAITPNGQFVYVTLAGTNSVGVISTASNTVVDTIPVGAAPVRISITPDGTTAYVSNQNSGDVVSVISLATNTVITDVLVGSTPYGSAVTPDGAFDWVIDAGSGQISVISTATNTIAATLALSGGSDIAIAAAPPTSQPLTQPLSPTLPNVFNFGTNSFTVQYPPGTSFSNVNMTVTDVEITQAQFQQRVAGTQFANATCIVYSGAGGNCVDDQVTCSESGSPITCPSEATPTIAVQTAFSTSQAITNPGYLTTPIGENEWQNIFTGFSDPIVKGRTAGFSEFVGVDLGTTNAQGAGVMTFLAPLLTTDPRVFGAGAAIPVTFQLTSIANPTKPVTDAVASLTIVMVSNASGAPESTVVLALDNAFTYRSGIGYVYQVNTGGYEPGQYVVTVYGDAFAAQQVQFTIKGRVATSCVINTSSSLFSAGQHITFTARVTVPSATGTPTGTITFFDSADSHFVLGTAALVGGTASINVVLHAPPPRQWIEAVYSGDNNFQSCTSPYIPEDYLNN
jgi:YVTN family beta-propeller protein/probable HAF family extracellular repeat protein